MDEMDLSIWIYNYAEIRISHCPLLVQLLTISSMVQIFQAGAAVIQI